MEEGGAESARRGWERWKSSRQRLQCKGRMGAVESVDYFCCGCCRNTRSLSRVREMYSLEFHVLVTSTRAPLVVFCPMHSSSPRPHTPTFSLYSSPRCINKISAGSVPHVPHEQACGLRLSDHPNDSANSAAPEEPYGYVTRILVSVGNWTTCLKLFKLTSSLHDFAAHCGCSCTYYR